MYHDFFNGGKTRWLGGGALKNRWEIPRALIFSYFRKAFFKAPRKNKLKFCKRGGNSENLKRTRSENFIEV